MNVLKKLSKKLFFSNKQRNVIGIFAIILTTILFTTIISIVNEILYMDKQVKFYQVGKNTHVDFAEVTESKIEKIKSHNLVEKIGVIRGLGSAINKEFKTPLTVLYNDENYFSARMGMELVGELPKKINEVVLCESELKALGKESKIGENITLELFTMDNRKIEKEFILSGYINEEDIEYDVFQRLAFISNELIHEIYYGTNFEYNIVGVYLKNDKNIKKDVDKILTDIGYQNIDENAENYIKVDINYAYENSMDLLSTLIIFILLFLFILSGYLIIYNVFYISLIKDIKLYGQLKTIGTTSSQLKKLMNMQVYYMCLIGIPIGLIMGYILSKIFLPIIKSNMTYSNIESAGINILVFLISGVFAFGTVWISCRKSIKVVSNVSPIESTKYIENTKVKKNIKKSKKGAKIYLIAYENFKRNKRKTILLVLSLSISGALINSTINFISNFNEKMFLDIFSVADFRLQDSLVNNSVLRGDDTRGIPKSFIEDIKKEDGYTSCGEVYTYNPKMLTNTNEDEIKDYVIVEEINNNIIENPIENNNYHRLLGFSQLPFEEGLIIKEGELDWEKFNSGNYIIEMSYDSNKSYLRYKIGDKIKINYQNGNVDEYEVMAIAYFKNSSIESTMSNNNSILGISFNKFQELFPNQLPLDFWLNVEDGNEEKFKKIFEPYLQSEEANLRLETLDGLKKDFEQVKQPFLIGGGALSLIIFLIGILNYINITISNIYSKRKEYAMMRSIGLSEKQLKYLILFEGMWYFIFSSITSIILSIILSVFGIRIIGPQIISGYFDYQLVLYPVIIVSLVLLIIIYIISYFAINKIKSNNIIEELRME